MRRAAVLIAAFLLFPLAPRPLSAQADPTWTRGYSERGTSGCIEYVAAWSDGSYTSTPWDCGSGVARAGTLTATRGYPQVAGNGCTEYVTQWTTGVYSWTPFSCPAGVVYYKSQARGMQQLGSAVAPPVLPVTPSAPPISPPAPPARSGNCHPSYPTVCIPPPPPDLDCGEIPFRRFQVLPPDPHRLDGDRDGIGCE
ncbi:MAG: hypothetical protein U0556_09760 [Dehalococcoidia bacterium]